MAEYEVADLERSGMDVMLMIAPESLLVLGGAEGRAFVPFLKEVEILKPELILRGFLEHPDPGRAECDLWEQGRLCVVYHEERSFTSGTARSGSVGPEHRLQVVGPLLAVLLQAVISSGPEALQNLGISPFRLPITLG
jgi:hypothetical protein